MCVDTAPKSIMLREKKSRLEIIKFVQYYILFMDTYLEKSIKNIGWKDTDKVSDNSSPGEGGK